MKKEIKGFILGCAVTAAVGSGVAIASNATNIEVYPNNVEIYANNHHVDSPNFTYNDTTYVPLRAVLELMDCSIEYDTDTKTVQAKNNYQDLTDTVGACFNGDSTVYRTIMNVAETTGNIFIDANAFVDYDFTLTKGGEHLMFMDNDKYVAIDTDAHTSNTEQQSYQSDADTDSDAALMNFPWYLYSDEPKPVYLGKLTTNSYDSESVYNTYGNYGSKYSQTSIFNTYSNYGSDYSMYSAFNPYASNPPIIYDSNFNIVGKLTANTYLANGYCWEVIDQFLKQYNQ